MTKITYYRTEDAFEVRLDGHAGYAGYGNDIVCASLSTLIQTLLTGFRGVQESFPKYVSITEVGCPILSKRNMKI